jgi:hypothetical protein
MQQHILGQFALHNAAEKDDIPAIHAQNLFLFFCAFDRYISAVVDREENCIFSVYFVHSAAAAPSPRTIRPFRKNFWVFE